MDQLWCIYTVEYLHQQRWVFYYYMRQYKSLVYRALRSEKQNKTKNVFWMILVLWRAKTGKTNPCWWKPRLGEGKEWGGARVELFDLIMFSFLIWVLTTQVCWVLKIYSCALLLYTASFLCYVFFLSTGFKHYKETDKSKSFTVLIPFCWFLYFQKYKNIPLA